MASSDAINASFKPWTTLTVFPCVPDSSFPRVYSHTSSTKLMFKVMAMHWTWTRRFAPFTRSTTGDNRRPSGITLLCFERGVDGHGARPSVSWGCLALSEYVNAMEQESYIDTRPSRYAVPEIPRAIVLMKSIPHETGETKPQYLSGTSTPSFA